ncbi:MAG: cytosolic protein, partial [Odoribacteraceae bacterium]|nr:cytosolic protein [Odoribacteraceae bacterium]
AFISSNEETLFGNWLEGLAIFINQKARGGRKSGITGIDLEFDRNDTRYIVAIKSGPNWGNSSQINKMKSDFLAARRTLRTSNSNLLVTAVNGCCYGRESHPDKGDYFKYCGQEFWYFISGIPSLFTDIIEPLGHDAKEKNARFQEEHACMINKFTREFTSNFCNEAGQIDWKRLVEFSSGNANSSLREK